MKRSLFKVLIILLVLFGFITFVGCKGNNPNEGGFNPGGEMSPPNGEVMEPGTTDPVIEEVFNEGDSENGGAALVEDPTSEDLSDPFNISLVSLSALASTLILIRRFFLICALISS